MNDLMGIYQRCYNECNWTSQSTDWMAWNLTTGVAFTTKTAWW